MSKWTLTRKTHAAPKNEFQKLREGCFEMKVDHCKNQGATMFDFRKMMVKLMFTIEIERQYKTLWRRPGVNV